MFKIGENKIHFHKSYMDRLPKRYFPVFSGNSTLGDIDITLNVRRNIQGSKYFWILVFLGRTFVFWSEEYSDVAMREFSQVITAYVQSFESERLKNSRVCNVLTQKFFV